MGMSGGDSPLVEREKSKNENWFDRPAAHHSSADFRDTAEHPRPVLGIEAGVAAETAHILGTVHAGCAIAVFLDNEDLFLLQIVEQTDIVRGDEKLCAGRIGLLGAEPAEYFASHIHVKITVNLVEGPRACHR